MSAQKRVGVLIVTHGDAGVAMRASVEALVGVASLAGFEALAVPPREPRAGTLERIGAALTRLDTGAGVLVACDLLGATPMNCAMHWKRAGRAIEVLGGVNLPMVIKLATVERTGTTAAALAHIAIETAVRSIQLGRLGEGE